MVFIGSDSTISIRESGLVITFKPVVAGAKDVTGMEIDPLVDTGKCPIYSIAGMVEGVDVASSVTIKSSLDKG